MAIHSSRVFITETSLVGADGFMGGPGGDALRVEDSDVHLQSCRVLVGNGGQLGVQFPLDCTGPSNYLYGGLGGDGIRCLPSTTLHLIECEVRAGVAVNHPQGVCTNLLAQDISMSPDTSVDPASRFGVSLSVPNIATEGTDVTVAAEGTPQG